MQLADIAAQIIGPAALQELLPSGAEVHTLHVEANAGTGGFDLDIGFAEEDGHGNLHVGTTRGGSIIHTGLRRNA